MRAFLQVAGKPLNLSTYKVSPAGRRGEPQDPLCHVFIQISSSAALIYSEEDLSFVHLVSISDLVEWRCMGAVLSQCHLGSKTGKRDTVVFRASSILFSY